MLRRKQMTKTELIQKIASSTKITRAEASKALDVTLNAIKNSLKKRQKVILVEFGTFSVQERRARNGRNPKTGDVISIARQKTPKFTAGKSLKDAIK
jgi:DNA-binding protein HU-beta